jgi:hypothetical protein
MASADSMIMMRKGFLCLKVELRVLLTDSIAFGMAP